MELLPDFYEDNHARAALAGTAALNRGRTPAVQLRSRTPAKS